MRNGLSLNVSELQKTANETFTRYVIMRCNGARDFQKKWQIMNGPCHLVRMETETVEEVRTV